VADCIAGVVSGRREVVSYDLESLTSLVGGIADVERDSIQTIVPPEIAITTMPTN